MPIVPPRLTNTRVAEAPLQLGRIATTGNALDQLGGGLQVSAKVFAGVQAEERDKADRHALIDAERQLGEIETAMLYDSERGAYALRGEDAFDLPNRLLPAFDDAARRIEHVLPERIRPAFGEMRNRTRQSIDRGANRHEYEQREAGREAGRIARIAQARELSITHYADGDRVEQEIWGGVKAINERPIAPEARAEQAAELRDDTYVGVVDRYLANGQLAGATKYYEAIKNRVRGDAATRIESELRKARAQAEYESRVRRNEARAALREREADAFAFAARGRTGTLPARSEYLAAFGAEGPARYSAAVQILGIQGAVSTAVLLPPQEAQAVLSQYAPTEQTGAADQSEILSRAQRVYSEQRAAFEADPAGYLLSRDEHLRARFDRAISREAAPSDVREYIARVRTAQVDAGVEKVQILPEAQRRQVASALAFDPERPTARSDNLQALSRQFGQHFPVLLREIAPELEGGARAMTMMDPESAARFDRATAAAGKTASLFKGDGPYATVASEVQSAIDRELDPLAGTLQHAPDGPERWAEVREAARVLAYDAVTRGSSPQAAASKAVASIIGGYTITEGMRIPKDRDPRLVLLGARKALTDGLPGFDLRLVPGLRFRTPEETRELIVANAVRRGVWRNSPDESGLTLYIPRGDGFATVVDASGEPVQLAWERLSEIGAAAQADKQWLRELTRKAAGERAASEFGPGLGDPR